MLVVAETQGKTPDVGGKATSHTKSEDSEKRPGAL